MAEVYCDLSKQWKHHLQGSWAFLHQYPRNSPWNQSQFTCFSTQSLVIVRIIGETSLIDKDYDATPMLNFTSPQIMPPLLLHAMDVTSDPFMLPMGPTATEENFASSIAATPEFGFTIGAQKMILHCISLITSASRLLKGNNSTSACFDVNRVIPHVLACLEQCQAQANSMPSESMQPLDSKFPWTELDTKINHQACYQLNAFIFATYIYLYQTLLDVPPRQVAVYVSLVFENISAFQALGGDNFSLWPAFVAAAEAYTDQGIASA